MDSADVRPAMHVARWAGCLLAGAMFCGAPAAGAAGRLQVSAATVEWAGVRASGVGFTLVRTASGATAVEATATRVQGLAGAGTLSRLRLACPRLALSDAAIACSAGRLSGNFGVLGRQRTPLAASLEGADLARLRLPALSLAGGRLSVEARSRSRRWSLAARFNDVDLARLALVPPLAHRLPGGFSLSGRAGGSLDAAGQGTQPSALQAAGEVAAASFANPSGSLAGEKLAATYAVKATLAPRKRDGWQLGATLSGTGGQAYLEPVFLDLGARPVRLELDGRLAADAASLSIGHFRVVQQGIGSLAGTAEVDLGTAFGLRKARTRFDDVDLAGVAQVYVAPFLVGTSFQDLHAAGHASGEADLDAGRPSRLDVELQGVRLDTPAGTLAVEGLGGHLRWFDESLRQELAPGADSAAFASELGWRSLRLWGIESGPVTVPFTTTGNNFRLLEPVRLPIFDGGLAVTTLRVRHAATPDMYVRLDAKLEPVSVGLLTQALGWPRFGGTIAGSIPDLKLSHGLVTLGGDLEARVFDGSVRIHGLRMREPLGRHPQFFADIDVDALDLGRLTNTFEFGSITGRLSGRIAGLEMFDWMPVSFDARFYTTPGDRSRHRISQRAVTNLSSIGGGSGGSVAAALQSGFLRFFDSFRYDRLGLSCRLANDVCTMDGVAPAKTGYYIVKGAGLPRIDVIGNQRQVAWTRLVQQLAAIMQSPGPVVR